MKTEVESPKYVQTSLAGAMALGLERGKFYRDAYPGSLNLLLAYQEGCRANCSYCGLARERSQYEDETFIRVKWPAYELELITDILKRQAEENAQRQFGRICVSMVTHPQAADDCLKVVNALRRAVDIPVSILTSPTLIAHTKLFFVEAKNAGADRVGVAVDAATPELFDQWRGKTVRGPHQWSKYWKTVDDAVEVFGRDKVSIHLIVGLGETEQEMVQTIITAAQHGAQAHLFSFCPEPGTAMAAVEPPSLGQYRRIQLAAYMINNKLVSGDGFKFNEEGQIISYGKSLAELLGRDFAGGKPFMTSGCPNTQGCVACNRPYGNERPGPVLRNYPFTPNCDDIALIRSQLWDGIQEDSNDQYCYASK